MLKANAWPYPVFEDVAYELSSAKFEGRNLQWKSTNRGHVVDALRLRDIGRGNVVLVVKLLTAIDDVARHVFADGALNELFAGFKVLCQGTKFRQFISAV